MYPCYIPTLEEAEDTLTPRRKHLNYNPAHIVRAGCTGAAAPTTEYTNVVRSPKEIIASLNWCSWRFLELALSKISGSAVVTLLLINLFIDNIFNVLYHVCSRMYVPVLTYNVHEYNKSFGMS